MAFPTGVQQAQTKGIWWDALFHSLIWFTVLRKKLVYRSTVYIVLFVVHKDSVAETTSLVRTFRYYYYGHTVWDGENRILLETPNLSKYQPWRNVVKGKRTCATDLCIAQDVQ